MFAESQVAGVESTASSGAERASRGTEHSSSGKGAAAKPPVSQGARGGAALDPLDLTPGSSRSSSQSQQRARSAPGGAGAPGGLGEPGGLGGRRGFGERRTAKRALQALNTTGVQAA